MHWNRRWLLMKLVLRKKWHYVVTLLAACCLLVVLVKIRQKGIPLIVVEEHHEVLPYWFKAAEDGVISKQSNTLIHIDGHPDQALPMFIKSSFFNWPRTKSDIRDMMQKNDIFIQAAAMAGLIDRFIYIWPSWDKDTDERTPAVKFQMVLGFLKANNTYKSYCSCIIEKEEAECSVDDNSYWQPSWHCMRMRSYMFEYVIDHVALQRLMTGKTKWPVHNAGVILDIDEDYFGCELGATPLLEAGVKWPQVDKVSLQLQALFCPTKIEHESWSNDMLRAVISSVIASCRHMTIAGHCVMTEKEASLLMAPVIKKYFHKYPTLGCTIGPVRDKWRPFTEALLELRRNDMKAVVDLGFCLTQSLESYDGDHGGCQIAVCAGANKPNRSIVYAHTATEAEVDSRMSDLTLMLQKIHENTRPSIVTLCRSVRDGYTPRRQFTKIERGILDIFANKIGKNARYDVIYDPNLFGGVRGWPSRHNVLP